MGLKIFDNHDLNKIYLSEAVRNMSNSMIQIFIPIYLLTHGYSLRAVVMFYIVASITHIVLSVPVGALGAKIGYKYLILLSIPFSIIFFLLLKDVNNLLMPLWLLSIIKEVGGTLYWVGRHSLLGFYTNSHAVGKQIGVNKILSSIAKIPAPLIGGILLATFGIPTLVLVVTILLVVSVIPLVFLRENWSDDDFSMAKVFSKLHFYNAPIFMVQGIDNVIASDLVWPTFLYFYTSFKYIGLGALSFLSDTASLAMNYIIGSFLDKGRHNILRWGAIGMIGIWVARILTQKPLNIYIIESVSGIIDPLVQVPFGATSYKIAKKNHFLQMIVFREIAIQSGKLIALTAVFAIGSLRYSLLLGLLYPIGYIIFKFYESTKKPSQLKPVQL